MPINYQNGKIYKIVCNVTDEVYIGSTCQPTVARRMAKHVDNYKEHKKGKCGYTTSFRIIERGDYNAYLIESFPCDSKDELTKREGEVIRQMKNECTVVNCVIPGRTRAEYRVDNADKIKEYRENNPEKIKAYRENNPEKIKAIEKKYRENNADKIKAGKQKWREQNADKIKTDNHKWREQNADKIKEYRKTKYTCECGSEICMKHKSRHGRTTKHIKFIESKNEPAN
jgi:hypothetical protein